jgi:hypothetical protein
VSGVGDDERMHACAFEIGHTLVELQQRLYNIAEERSVLWIQAFQQITTDYDRHDVGHLHGRPRQQHHPGLTIQWRMLPTSFHPLVKLIS